jgi:hypothetical protein
MTIEYSTMNRRAMPGRVMVTQPGMLNLRPRPVASSTSGLRLSDKAVQIAVGLRL